MNGGTELIMIIPVSLGKESYDIVLKRGSLARIGELLALDRRVLILTDSGVPKQYSEAVASASRDPLIYTVAMGEQSKSLANFEAILRTMAQNRFTRTDCVVAVGGGVVGDLAGFVAASFMRGIDFYNIPTTLLSQVDSSIGGKVAVDLDGYKNIVGAFYQPKKVVIDPDLLSTLDSRQLRCGLAEALKMATTSDIALFESFERGEYKTDLVSIIERSLMIKKKIVEKDTKESGERKILNFGHTVGHAIESSGGLGCDLLHGECVAVGMLYMCSDQVRARLIPILKAIGLPCSAAIDPDEIYSFIQRDKKTDGEKITLTVVNEIGKAELRKVPTENVKTLLKI